MQLPSPHSSTTLDGEQIEKREHLLPEPGRLQSSPWLIISSSSLSRGSLQAGHDHWAASPRRRLVAQQCPQAQAALGCVNFMLHSWEGSGCTPFSCLPWPTCRPVGTHRIHFPAPELGKGVEWGACGLGILYIICLQFSFPIKAQGPRGNCHEHWSRDKTPVFPCTGTAIPSRKLPGAAPLAVRKEGSPLPLPLWTPGVRQDMFLI